MTNENLDVQFKKKKKQKNSNKVWYIFFLVTQKLLEVCLQPYTAETSALMEDSTEN